MVVKRNTPEALKPFEFHGLELSINGSQAQTDCPFCDSEKLFISKKTGQYDCKKCGSSGNKSTFLTMYHKAMLSTNVDTDFKAIRKMRGNVFPSSFIKQHKLCRDIDGNILFPHLEPGKENLSNLRKWQKGNKVFYNTPTCCSLFYAQWETEGPVFICEGEWDALALVYLMQRAKYETKCSVVSVPGANIFKETWVSKFKDRNVYLLYDNDHDKSRPDDTKFNPAKDGMEKASKLLAGVANKIKCIDWSKISDDLPDGYDVRDHLTNAIKAKKSKLYLRKLFDACVEQEGGNKSKSKQSIKTLKRTTFQEVADDWKQIYEFNQSFEDVLACCFATLISLYLSDRRNPLWLFIVAPPSSGKTTIIEGFKAATAHTEYLSELTPASLVTGLKLSDDYDPSLLSRANEKVWFIEDFTPILSMPGKDEIFGIFRAAYNGFYTAHFATHVRDYPDLHFAIVSGVTHAIERIDLGDLGERFLRIRLLDDSFNEEDHIRTALGNVGIREEQKQQLLGGVNGFIEHLMTHKEEPDWDSEMDDKLIHLSMFTALMRTTVHRDKSGISTRPVAEVASRIATELKKLGIALGVVHAYKKVNDECYRVMQKVAFDTSVGWSLELVQTLVAVDNEPLTVTTIAKKMNVHVNQARRIVENAMLLEIVESARVSNNSGRRGNKAGAYSLSQKVMNMLKKGKISFDVKRKTSSIRTKRSKIKRKKSNG